MNYKKGALIGACIGFFIVPLSLSSSLMWNLRFSFLEYFFLLKIFDALLQNLLPTLHDSIYNSDTWIILFPMIFMTISSSIYGALIGWIISKFRK